MSNKAPEKTTNEIIEVIQGYLETLREREQKRVQTVVLDVASLSKTFFLSDAISLQGETYIRKRTCHNKSKFARGGSRFICSACDFGSDWNMWEDDIGVPMDFYFKYCPECGAEVEE